MRMALLLLLLLLLLPVAAQSSRGCSVCCGMVHAACRSVL
jgi:predicted S18 family serine protease